MSFSTKSRVCLRACAFLALVAAAVCPLPAADHSDTALLNQIGRQNAQFTDLHAFVRSGDLVIVVSMNPAIPVSAATYQFPADLAVEIHIDNDSEVRFDDPTQLQKFGGTIVEPDGVEEDFTFRLTFDPTGTPTLAIVADEQDGDDESDDESDDGSHDETARVSSSHRVQRQARGASGLPGVGGTARQALVAGASQQPFDVWPVGLDPSQVQLFAGLRDDPFIRCPRAGRNIAAIVLQFDLSKVLDDQSTLLLWATSDIDDVFGPSEEIVGRALRSMFPENDMANVHPPGEHASRLGMIPDVMIYDTSQPAAFPNGRELLDDVVAIVADPRVVNTCPPLPNGNDLPFLSTFPYLAAPHPPVP